MPVAPLSVMVLSAAPAGLNVMPLLPLRKKLIFTLWRCRVPVPVELIKPTPAAPEKFIPSMSRPFNVTMSAGLSWRQKFLGDWCLRCSCCRWRWPVGRRESLIE